MDRSASYSTTITFSESGQDVTTGPSSSLFSGELDNTTVDNITDSLFTSSITTNGDSEHRVTKQMINFKQLKHDLELARIELSQKNLMIDTIKAEYLNKIDDLEEKIADSAYQKQLLVAQFQNKIQTTREELHRENQQLKKEVQLLLKQQQEISDDNQKLMEKAVESKDVLVNLHLEEDEYLDIKGKNVEDQTLTEFIALKFYESLKPLKMQCEALQNRIELYAVEISGQEEDMAKTLKELGEEREARTEMVIRCEKLQIHVEDLRDQLKRRDFKNENFDSLRSDKDNLERDLLDMRKNYTLTNADLDAKISENERMRAELNDLRQSVSLLKQDKDYLSRQISDIKPRHDFLEQKLEEAAKSLEDVRRSREELYEKYIHSRDHYKSEYEGRLRQEIDELSRKTSLEVDKIKMSSQEIYERENRALKEARNHALEEKQRFELIAKDAEDKYKDLLSELKHSQMSADSKISEVYNDLKLKSFELERLQLVHEEMCQNLKNSNLENEKLSKQKEALNKEYNRLDLTTGKRITEFEGKCSEMSKKLVVYEKMEEELDNVIMQAAEMSDDQEAEKVLFSYGYGANIPSTAKRRMQQSVHLAKRVLQLERANSSFRLEIDNERKKCEQISEELRRTTTLLSEAKQPYNCLIDSIKIRDDENKHMKDTIGTLNDDISRLKRERTSLKKRNDQMTLDLERLLNQREEMNVLKHAIVGMRTSGIEKEPNVPISMAKRKTVSMGKLIGEKEDNASSISKPVIMISKETPSWYSRLSAQNGKDRGFK